MIIERGSNDTYFYKFETKKGADIFILKMKKYIWHLYDKDIINKAMYDKAEGIVNTLSISIGDFYILASRKEIKGCLSEDDFLYLNDIINTGVAIDE